ncbi:MAG TPA: PQQ-binding-like beta-propeller repeat protein [Armatimonadota bacterium]|nr:PQQ-binding-like beta-propeller repeat protein [Armatimonadota bacterium]
MPRPLPGVHAWLALSLLSLAGCAPVSAEDWPHWRGPDRTDITSESSGYDAGAWPLGDAAWTKNVGRGASSPIAVGNRLYTMGWAANQETLWCFDAATGEDVWKQSYACPQYGRYHTGDESAYDSVCATPSYDLTTGYIYTLSIDGELNCWDANAEGAKLWGFSLYDTYDVAQRPNVGGGLRDYGYTTGPLVYADWVVVEVGDDEGTVMAFDKTTGTRHWASECKDPAGHTGGLVPMTVEGIPCIAVLTLHRLLVIRLDPGREGATLATYDWQTDFANNIPTPTVHEDTVILSTGYNVNRMERIKVSSTAATKMWDQRYITKVCCPVVYNGNVYFAWGKLRCLDLETGEQKWEGGAFRDDSSIIITSDGRIIVFGSRTIALVETADRSPNAYKELSRKDGVGSSQTWPHVALANGKLYAKDREGNLFCFSLQ